MSQPIRSSLQTSRCRTPRAFIAAGSGSSTPAPGTLGSIDLSTGKFEPLALCPGYLRGLAFVGDYAIMGMSRPRHDKTFGGLALNETLAAKGAEARCGLHIIDLRTGDCIEWLRLEGQVTELYDVAVLPDVTRPMILGFKSDEIERLLSIGPPAPL